MKYLKTFCLIYFLSDRVLMGVVIQETTLMAYFYIQKSRNLDFNFLNS